MRHISIDFWSTLYRPNPTFSIKRIDQIVQFYFSYSIDRNFLEDCLKEVGKQNDLLADTQGQSASQEELYHKVFSSLNLSVTASSVRALCETLEALFLKHPPLLIDPGYAFLLDRLSKKGLTMNIASNTAFVPGNALQVCIQQDGLYKYFDFMVFSDQVGAAKPAHSFFQEVFNRVNQQKMGFFAKEEILHVGDNPLADIKGAGSFGFKTLQVTAPSDLFKLLRYV